MISKKLSLLLFVILQNSYTSCEPSTPITESPSMKTCITKLASCGTDMKKLEFVGKIGPQGPGGLKGDKGASGRDGLPGYDGRQGDTGEPGRKGEVGAQGMAGLPGKDGLNGTTGHMGPRGDTGAKGENGIVGKTGVKGDRGIPGNPGTCGCEIADHPKPETPLPTEPWATKEKHGTVTCKNAPRSEYNKSTSFYYLKSGMEVKCDFGTMQTCLNHSSDNVINYNESHPFWLSEKSVTLKDLYGLDSEQLIWLQRESYTANMTIRYHCKNSNPVGDNAITLLSWNDVKVGHEPTDTTSFQYHVKENGCSTAAKDTWEFTDIVLVSPIVQRLPIVDFFVKDVGKENQALRIDIVQLCFG